VALQVYEGDDATKDAVAIFLTGSFCLWVVLNIVFFCTIDLSFINTFFGTKTAPQYVCDLFLSTTTDDSGKYRAVFTNRLDYTVSIESEVKEWVASNIARWKTEKPDWFRIEMIPDSFLPVEAEGGARRRRSRVSLRESFGITPVIDDRRVHPQR